LKESFPRSELWNKRNCLTICLSHSLVLEWRRTKEYYEWSRQPTTTAIKFSKTNKTKIFEWIE
jgi:hypothetical protein